MQVEAFKKQANDSVDDIQYKCDKVKEQTNPQGHTQLDDAVHKCRTSLAQSENEADSSLTSLSMLTDEFVDYSEEYDRQVGPQSLVEIRVKFSV